MVDISDSDDDMPLSSFKKDKVVTDPSELISVNTGNTVGNGTEITRKRTRVVVVDDDDEEEGNDDDQVPLFDFKQQHQKQKEANGTAATKTKKKAKTKEESESDEDDDIPLGKLISTASGRSVIEEPVSKIFNQDKKEKSTEKIKIKEKEKSNASVTDRKSLKSGIKPTIVKKGQKDKATRKKKKGIESVSSSSSSKKKKLAKASPVPKKRKKISDDDGESGEYGFDGSNEDDEIRWQTLQHNGVVFPPEYIPHGRPLIYDGKELFLEPVAEEIATFYASKLNTDHVKKPVFNKNFFNDFRKGLVRCKSKHKDTIKKFSLCNFSRIYAHLEDVKLANKEKTPAERKVIREAETEKVRKYTTAIVDGREEKVGNFRVEPPGLFLGRGEHPLTGQVKKRIMPEAITINIGKEAKVPECPLPGHRWGAVIHNQRATWLASWKDTITGESKYVFLGAGSAFKGMSDFAKYEKARMLAKSIDVIRTAYQKGMKSNDLTVRQLSVATYLIDKLALRVGMEKGEDEADTVGCCSLRVEHVKFIEPDLVEFDFLGKDSIRYRNTVPVDKLAFENMKKFAKEKKPTDNLFEMLNGTKLNKHLQEFMPGISAKVFRTYNASVTLDRLLRETPTALTMDEKIEFYNKANKEVAILCNHQRSTTVGHRGQMDKLEDKLKDSKSVLKQMRKALKDSSKDSDKVEITGYEDPKPVFTKEMTYRQREEEKKRVEALPKEKVIKSYNRSSLETHIERIQTQITKMELKIRMKDDLKDVALSTSKLNYNDPRITVAWCKRHEVNIEKVFAGALLVKFAWAMDISMDYIF